MRSDGFQRPRYIPSSFRLPTLGRQLAPLLSLELRRDDVHLAFFTTVTTFGTPQDVTVQELRIETYFPADDHTRRFLYSTAG